MKRFVYSIDIHRDYNQSNQHFSATEYYIVNHNQISVQNNLKCKCAYVRMRVRVSLLRKVYANNQNNKIYLNKAKLTFKI